MGKKKVKKPKMRIPLPKQVEKPHSTKKGEKGYKRKREKRIEEAAQ
jgi:hypothetical protein